MILNNCTFCIIAAGLRFILITYYGLYQTAKINVKSFQYAYITQCKVDSHAFKTAKITVWPHGVQKSRCALHKTIC